MPDVTDEYGGRLRLSAGCNAVTDDEVLSRRSLASLWRRFSARFLCLGSAGSVGRFCSPSFDVAGIAAGPAFVPDSAPIGVCSGFSTVGGVSIPLWNGGAAALASSAWSAAIAWRSGRLTAMPGPRTRPAPLPRRAAGSASRGPALEAIEAPLALAGVAEAVACTAPEMLSAVWQKQLCGSAAGSRNYRAKHSTVESARVGEPQGRFRTAADSVTKETFHCPDAMICDSASACPAPAVAA